MNSLSRQQFCQAVFAAENGGFVSSFVMRCLPDARPDDIDREVNRVYDAMEMPEEQH